MVYGFVKPEMNNFETFVSFFKFNTDLIQVIMSDDSKIKSMI